MHTIAYGIDYVRFKVEAHQDVQLIGERLPYVELQEVWHHGVKFVDLGGGALELVRMFDDVQAVIIELATILQVYRLDVYADVEGYLLLDIEHPGTVISNEGYVETVYSHNLKNRGNLPAFGRMYDARKAEHYDVPVTRIEIELKREIAKGIIDHRHGFRVNPIAVLVHYAKEFFGVRLDVAGVVACEYKGVRKKYEHDRSRFYKRYGNGILDDMDSMGAWQLRKFIIQCLLEKQAERAKDVSSEDI